MIFLHALPQADFTSNGIAGEFVGDGTFVLTGIAEEFVGDGK